MREHSHYANYEAESLVILNLTAVGYHKPNNEVFLAFLFEKSHETVNIVAFYWNEVMCESNYLFD